MAYMTTIVMDVTYGAHGDEFTWPDYAYLCSGIFLVLVFILALLGNSTVIFLFAWDRNLRTPTNMFLLSLAISDWLVTVTGIPLVTSSIFAHRWLFSHAGCISYAFIMTFLGLNSLMSHAVIAVDRYLVITKPHFGIVVTYPKAFLMISVPWGFGLLWAVFPLVGWGEYDYEGPGAWCSIMWESDRPDIMAYVLGMMFLTFVSSILVMIYCYICIFLTMRRMPRFISANSIKTHERNRRKRELKLVKTLFALAVAFLLSWAPYAVVSMIAIFGYSDMLSATASTLPSMFAKGSVMMNPIIYAITSRVFRSSFKKMLNSFFPGMVVWLETTKSPPSSSKRTQPFSSEERRKRSIQEDKTSSVLIPGSMEICASHITISPSRVVVTEVNPSGHRSSAAIEMDRLNKLLPGKHKKGRISQPGRRASDFAIPETGYKAVMGQVSGDDEDSAHHDTDKERQTSETAEGAIGITEDTSPSHSIKANNNCSLELDHIIDGLRVKYVGTNSDADDIDDINCDKIRAFSEKETKKRDNMDKRRCIILSDVGKEERTQAEHRKGTVLDNEESSHSSAYADSGVFDTNPAYNTAKKSPDHVQRETETKI